jgi:hypothetical protein
VIAEFLDVPAETHAEHEPAAGQMRDRGDLLGQQDRIVDRY